MDVRYLVKCKWHGMLFLVLIYSQILIIIFLFPPTPCRLKLYFWCYHVLLWLVLFAVWRVLEINLLSQNFVKLYILIIKINFVSRSCFPFFQIYYHSKTKTKINQTSLKSFQTTTHQEKLGDSLQHKLDSENNVFQSVPDKKWKTVEKKLQYLYFLISYKTKKVECCKIQAFFVIYVQCMPWFPDGIKIRE